jgi:Holliday junction resolvase RusA-like endonuclease
MTHEGKALKERYQWESKMQWKEPILVGPIYVIVRLYFGTKRKADIDNFNKILYDALTGIVWEDDSQIMVVVTEKHYDKENPRITIGAEKFLGYTQ